MRWRCAADRRVDGVPHTVAVPAVGSSSPTSRRTVVVLPHPLGPISPTMLPGGDLQVQLLDDRIAIERLAQALTEHGRLAR